MGRPIVYCSDCGRSLREDDFQKGHAATLDNRPFCSTCREIDAPPPPVTPRSAPSPVRTPKPFAAPPAKPNIPLVAGAVCGFALVLLILGVTLSGRRPPPPPSEPVETPPAPPPRKEPAEAVERAAAEKERSDRFERHLRDIRAALDDARFDDRREEIRAMLAKAGELAGARQAEVDGLSALFTRRQREASLRAGLVGRWKLDDVPGTSASDAGPNGLAGKVVGKAGWTAARIDGGLETFGGGEHVELPDAPVLKNLNLSSFSLSAWYLPRDVPAGNDGPMHGLIVKPGHHTGLMFLSSSVFRLELWIGGKQVNLLNPEKSAPGRFYHVAGTVDTEAGAAALYVDGLKVKDGTWAKAAMRDYGAERWRIGACFPSQKRNWGPSKGILDDVRLYSRALSADEIGLLYASQR